MNLSIWCGVWGLFGLEGAPLLGFRRFSQVLVEMPSRHAWDPRREGADRRRMYAAASTDKRGQLRFSDGRDTLPETLKLARSCATLERISELTLPDNALLP